MKEPVGRPISQLTMLLYLLTRCHMKTVYSKQLTPDISPLADILDLIGEAQKLISSNDVLDQLILKLTERLAAMFVTDVLKPRNSEERLCACRLSRSLA